jgi:hypothetical protein
MTRWEAQCRAPPSVQCPVSFNSPGLLFIYEMEAKGIRIDDNAPGSDIGTTAAKEDKKRDSREGPTHDPKSDLGRPQLEERIDVGVFRVLFLIKNRDGVPGPPRGRALGNVGGYGKTPAVFRGEAEYRAERLARRPRVSDEVKSNDDAIGGEAGTDKEGTLDTGPCSNEEDKRASHGQDA